jgi:hypothetical protein
MRNPNSQCSASRLLAEALVTGLGLLGILMFSRSVKADYDPGSSMDRLDYFYSTSIDLPQLKLDTGKFHVLMQEDPLPLRSRIEP